MADVSKLILTMLTALDEYGDHFNFTKDDIDLFVKKYLDLDAIDCNELGCIILWEEKYITGEKFADLMNVYYDNGTFYSIFDDFEDCLPRSLEHEANILDNGVDDYDFSTYDTDVSSYWSDYNNETLQEIIKFCINNGIEIDDELLTNKNLSLKNDDIYFNDEKLSNYINDDDLSELKKCLNFAICEAQHVADRDDIYTQIKNNFEDKIGTYKFIDIKGTEKIRINFDHIDWSDIKSNLSENDEFNFEDDEYGTLEDILNEFDYFDMDKPDYRYSSGTIEDSYLNEITQSQLESY